MPDKKIRRLTNGRSMGKNRPRFGLHYYMGSHRYVYYVNGRPQYYFSDRPYTIEDAKKWRNRCLLIYSLSAVLFATILLQNPLALIDQVHNAQNGPEMLAISVLCLGLAVFYAVKFVIVLGLKPEEDPMLQSFICVSDMERPREETCRFCGGVYSVGAHPVCPHCGSPIS